MNMNITTINNKFYSLYIINRVGVPRALANREAIIQNRNDQ